ncbi:MAG: hypothetical protein K6F44_01235 [Lachnospiraceae bacterium]|nr:hypothetical protein [Lachnospiraceae bacterium]
MRIKRILALFICVVMAVSLAPITAKADTEKEYTVILSPGEGSGEPIVYSADKSEITKTWRDAGNCEFYLEDGSVGFKIETDYCPDSFTAPEGKSFEKWDGQAGRYTTIQRGTTTFTVIWGLPKYDGDSINNIPPFSGDECYTIAGIEWKLIGKDEERGIGLLIAKNIIDNLIIEWEAITPEFDSLSFGFTRCFDNGEQPIIPTSKAEEQFFHEQEAYYSSALSESYFFALSAPEVEYYDANDMLSQKWWTRSRAVCDYYVAVTDKGIDYNVPLDEFHYIRPAFQVDLNKLNDYLNEDTVQALPPAFPEGVFQTKTGVYKITDEAKKEVQMIEGSVSAKGVLTVPKTVTYEKKRYKVTSIREMTFDGNSELKTIKITAGNLREVGDNAFRFINKKAVFKIKGTVKAFKKLRKVIKSSAGLPKTVKFKRVKVK